MNMTLAYTDIKVIDDIITQDEAKYLVDIADTTPQGVWDQCGSMNNQTGFWVSRNLLINLTPIDQGLIDSIIQRCKDAFFREYDYSPEKVAFTLLNVIHRFTDGQDMGVHSDRGDYGDNSNVLFGFVIYLNDGYSGGELYYPELNFEITPKKYSLVMHPGTKEYAHGVKTVSGPVNRYTLTFFVTERQ